MKDQKNQQQPEVVETTEKKSIFFYPDVEYNRRERKKAIVLACVLVIFLAGMGLTIIVGSLKNPTDPMGWVMGLLMILMFLFAISLIPQAFKQHPVKKDPIIEVKPKEIVIYGETFKYADVKEARLTITLGPVGKKEENEKFLNSMLDKEPPANLTANLDFAVKDKGNKTKTLYTTIADAYEALVALYQAGFKHYTIVYSLKKLAKKGTYDIGQTKTETGATLSSLSKKERLKQLF